MGLYFYGLWHFFENSGPLSAAIYQNYADENGSFSNPNRERKRFGKNFFAIFNMITSTTMPQYWSNESNREIAQNWKKNQPEQKVDDGKYTSHVLEVSGIPHLEVDSIYSYYYEIERKSANRIGSSHKRHAYLHKWNSHL